MTTDPRDQLAEDIAAGMENPVGPDPEENHVDPNSPPEDDES